MRHLALIAAAALAVLAALPASAAEVGCFASGRGAPGPYRIEFTTGSAKIGPEGAKTLDEVAKNAKARASKLCLLGRADRQGNAAANRKLSRQRADAVSAALQKRGVSAGMITIAGQGAAFGGEGSVLRDIQEDRVVEITLSK